MKKILLLLLAITLAFTFSACTSDIDGSNPDENPGADEGTDPNNDQSSNEDKDPVTPALGLQDDLESILEHIYENGEFGADFTEYIIPGLITGEITAENSEYHLGKSGLDIKEGIVSEHEMSGSAYALCLVRAGEDADIEHLKKEISDNVDPFKWICVGVSAENVIVDNIEDVVILIMSESDAHALHAAFLALAE